MNDRDAAPQELERHLASWVDDLQSRGRYTFSRQEAGRAHGGSMIAVGRALARLRRKGRIAVPRQGFYVVVPLEYRSTGAPPAPWFITDLLEHLGQDGYVGLLTAAAQMGAAHQQPLRFQVVTDRPTRPAEVGRVRLEFVTSAQVRTTPAEEVRTPTGSMRMSTPEATALDLVRFARVCGGLSNVATVLGELGERLRPPLLAEAADQVETAVVQRAGWLLELTAQAGPASALADWLAERRTYRAPLRPDLPRTDSPRNTRWNLIINDVVEPDL